MAGGRASKQKGSRYELEVVRALQDHGIAAEKIPLSGAVKGGSFEGDILCPIQGADRKLECKRRARQFATIDQMLGANYALVCRDDRSRNLVVMTLDTFAALALLRAEAQTDV
jgi:hypothetical protein